jgi:HEAT repeat protein
MNLMKRPASASTSIADELVRAGYRYNAEGLREAIERLGPALRLNSDSVVSSLLAKLRDRNNHVRETAAAAMRCLGVGTSNQVIQRLLKMLNSRKSLTRYYGVAAVGEIFSGDPPEPLFQTLVSLLDDSGSGVRWRAIGVLGRAKEATEPVLHRLPALLEDADEYVVFEAAWAIRRFGAAVAVHEPIHNAVRRLLEHPNHHIAKIAAKILEAVAELETNR